MLSLSVLGVHLLAGEITLLHLEDLDFKYKFHFKHLFKLHCNEHAKVYLHGVLLVMIYPDATWKIQAACVL